MTAENQNIMSDFYSGNHKLVTVTVRDGDGQLKDISTAQEIMYAIYNDDDGLICYKTSAEIGEITVGGTGNADATVELLPKDSFTLTGLYRHEMTIVDASGIQETVMRGKVQIYRSYAQRRKADSLHAYLAGG